MFLNNCDNYMTDDNDMKMLFQGQALNKTDLIAESHYK